MLYNIEKYYLNVKNHGRKMKIQRWKSAIFRHTEEDIRSSGWRK
jgi:hypothetical protein